MHKTKDADPLRQYALCIAGGGGGGGGDLCWLEYYMVLGSVPDPSAHSTPTHLQQMSVTLHR